MGIKTFETREALKNKLHKQLTQSLIMPKNYQTKIDSKQKKYINKYKERREKERKKENLN